MTGYVLVENQSSTSEGAIGVHAATSASRTIAIAATVRPVTFTKFGWRSTGRLFPLPGSRTGRSSGLKWLPLPREPSLEALGAIAVATRPRLVAIDVAAAAARVSVLHLKQLEILLPVRPFFGQRC